MKLVSGMGEYRKEQAQQRAALCRIFSNSKRVLILWTLAEKKLAVSDIARAIGVSLQNTSQHLRLMKSAGILASQREGKTIIYRLAENSFSETCQLLVRAKKASEKDASS